MKKFFFSFFKTTYGAVFTVIMMLMVFFSGGYYACKKEYFLSNIEIVAVILVLFFGYVAYLYFTKDKKALTQTKRKVDTDKLIAAFTAVLFMGQCYVFYNIFFTSGWDVRPVQTFAEILLKGEDVSAIERYYSVYPNNLFLSYVIFVFRKINSWIGIFNGEYSMMCIVVINCAINSFICWLTYKTTRLFTPAGYAVFAYFMAVFSVGISGWSIICYSDAVALLFPLSSVYLYCRNYRDEKMKWIGYIGSVAVSVVGYFVKPQCLFVAIAMLLVEGGRFLSKISLKKLVRPVALCLTVLLTFCFVNASLDMANKRYGIDLDEERTLGITHFLMMGANAASNGVYHDEDVRFSKSFATAEERNKANVEEAINRIKEMKLGFLDHAKRKMLTTFNDGSFAWMCEGNFFAFTPEKNLNNKMAPFLKSIFCGDRFNYLGTVQHFVWVAILLFALATLTLKKRYKFKWEMCLFWIVILGFVLYEVIFEVRARYVYIFVPMLCTLAAIGFKSAVGRACEIIPGIKKITGRIKTK